MMRAIPRAALALILALAASLVGYFEGSIPHTYADPVGIPTICSGHTGPDVVPGRVAEQGECERLLRADLELAFNQVVRCIGVTLKPNEAAALTSFAFNVGGDALCKSTLARLANQGHPASEWCAELDKWVYARKGGISVRLPGLVRRRAAERAMCEGRPWMASRIVIELAPLQPVPRTELVMAHD